MKDRNYKIKSINMKNNHLFVNRRVNMTVNKTTCKVLYSCLYTYIFLNSRYEMIKLSTIVREIINRTTDFLPQTFFLLKISKRTKIHQLCCNLMITMNIHQIYMSNLTPRQCQNMIVLITKFTELKLISQYIQETAT